ncbi:hypothetical protein [Luteimonas aquatica]|uniref:hypothetical protein n=1 Tax=Luteimonas aquatica TaxID=450364 RepID=UPI001F591D4B|nr:hypothetical protein [Luteimonas aquatica]
MLRSSLLAAAVLLAAMALPAAAQEVVLPQPENVRTEYAQVLRAQPVYQTLRATSMTEECEEPSGSEKRRHRAADGEEQRGFMRFLDSVKGVFSSDADARQADEPGTPPAKDAGRKCRLVPVDKEFRRPIAYDIDYVHHGIKYRSRLPYDPGNRLRVRVSVTPIVAGGDSK